MTDEKIKNSSELEFAVFCIEDVYKRQYHMRAVRA